MLAITLEFTRQDDGFFTLTDWKSSNVTPPVDTGTPQATTLAVMRNNGWTQTLSNTVEQQVQGALIRTTQIQISFMKPERS